MNRLKLLQLKLSINLRKSILNKMLVILSPSNKLMIALSQNLDKYIVAYHKKIYEIYNSKQLYSISKSF